MRFTFRVSDPDASDAQLTKMLAGEPPEVVELVLRLRAVVRAAHPDLEEKINPMWHGIAYRHRRAGYVCGLFPRRGGVNVGFEHGADHPDPLGRLVGKGRTRDVRIEVDAGPEEDDVVVDYLDLAVDLAIDRAEDKRRRR
jgi:hypothetical protein